MHHPFLETAEPVLGFLTSLVSVSLSSPTVFLFLFEPAPVLFAEVELVGVAWFEPPSPFIKPLDSGVGAMVAAGVDCADGIGLSYSHQSLCLCASKFR
jgi:hypothetical protein